MQIGIRARHIRPGTDSDISDEIWGWRYHTVDDDRVREEHEDLKRERLREGRGRGSLSAVDYNCRCSSEWITQSEAEEKG